MYEKTEVLASRQTLFWMEKLMKFVSTSTWYGGPSAVLYLKKSAEDVLGLQNIQAHLLVPLNISSFKDFGHKTFTLALDWGRTVSSRESVPFSLHKCTYHWTIPSQKSLSVLYILYNYELPMYSETRIKISVDWDCLPSYILQKFQLKMRHFFWPRTNRLSVLPKVHK